MRNSWGTGWGEQGYVRMTMTNTGLGICGNQVLLENITTQVNLQ
jgi:hypothetical protein